MGFSYETTVKVDGKDIKKFIEEFLGNNGQYEEQQKRFNEAAINDALTYFNDTYNHKTEFTEEMWSILESIAVTMYVKGFNRAFEYYIKHEDVFNLEGNEDTK